MQPFIINASSSSSYSISGVLNCDSIRLSVTPSVGNVNYLWNTGATSSSIEVVSNGTYTVSITDGSNCIVTDSIEVLLPVVNPIISSFTTIQDSCDVIDVSIQSSGGVENVNYIWNTGDTSSTIKVVNDGVYTITISDSLNCMITDSIEVLLPTNDTTKAIILNQFNNAFAFEGYSTASGNLTYHWDFGDGNSSTIQYPTHTYANIGTYQLILTVVDSFCSHSDTLSLSITTINNSGIVIQTHPNPSNNQLNIQYTSSTAGYIRIYDSFGYLVYEKSVLSTLLNMETVNVSSLPNGIYMIVLQNSTGKKSSTVLISR